MPDFRYFKREWPWGNAVQESCGAGLWWVLQFGDKKLKRLNSLLKKITASQSSVDAKAEEAADKQYDVV